MASKKRSKKVSKRSANNGNTAEEETKAAKFKRLGVQRTIKAVNSIRSLQKLANKNQYEYTDDQAAKIVGMLKDELEELHARFTQPAGTKQSVEFDL